MKGKELGQSRNKLRALLWVVIAVCITLTGCMRWGQPLLSRAVIQYDSNVLKSDEELLLLNIVRMHDDQPPHFTVASDIKATFSFGSTGGFAPSGWSTGTSKNILALGLTATTSNSPTITIAPMQGKDFATRILKPLDPGVAEMGFFQRGQQIDKLLRLIGHSFEMISPKHAQDKDVADGYPSQVNYPPEVVKYLTENGCFEKDDDCFLINRPPKKCEEEKPHEGSKKLTDSKRYELFRQVVLQIKAIQMNHGLGYSALQFDEEIERVKLKNPPEAKDVTDAADKQYRWEADKADIPSYVLKKRHMITGIVDSDLTAQDCRRIAKDLGLMDYIKYDYPVVVVVLKKGNWPIYGLLRLRSFRQILQFLAESLTDECGYEREYDVAPSPFTEALSKEKNLKPGKLENPPLTLTISHIPSGTKMLPLPTKAPRDRVVDTDYNGELFWVSSSPDQRWNKQVFNLLYEIFQMNRVEPPVSPPGISILK